ncbi:MAG: hypothetical protein JXL80_01035 [Planctomycetes bacterium]|nr:hypothetical protein [Planctomycetota bacterium]
MSDQPREEPHQKQHGWVSRVCPSPRKAPVPWILFIAVTAVLVAQQGIRFHDDYRATQLLRSGWMSKEYAESVISGARHVPCDGLARLYWADVDASIAEDGKPTKLLIAELSESAGLVVSWGNDGSRLEDILLCVKGREAPLVAVGRGGGVFPGSISVAPVTGPDKGRVLMDFDLDGEFDARVEADVSKSLSSGNAGEVAE